MVVTTKIWGRSPGHSCQVDNGRRALQIHKISPMGNIIRHISVPTLVGRLFPSKACEERKLFHSGSGGNLLNVFTEVGFFKKSQALIF